MSPGFRYQPAPRLRFLLNRSSRRQAKYFPETGESVAPDYVTPFMSAVIALHDLASCAVKQHYVLMSTGDEQTSRALAHAAEPLRDALRGYFRRRVSNSAEIDDLVQDVFARIVARGEGQAVEHLKGYVFQTAASVLVDHVRRRSSRHADAHVEFDPDRDSETDFDPEHILASRQDLQVVRKALLALPERTRTIFIMYRLEGKSLGEVAGQVGISVSAVQKHVVRALQGLAAAVGTTR